MDLISRAESWLCDMDGVLIRDGAMIPGADKFLDRLRSTGRPYLILTNNSLYTPREIREELSQMGLNVEESDLWDVVTGDGKFVHTQRPFGPPSSSVRRACTRRSATSGTDRTIARRTTSCS